MGFLNFLLQILQTVIELAILREKDREQYEAQMGCLGLLAIIIVSPIIFLIIFFILADILEPTYHLMSRKGAETAEGVLVTVHFVSAIAICIVIIRKLSRFFKDII